jgi:hypothetical protein
LSRDAKKKSKKKNHRQRPCQGTHKKNRPSPRRRLQNEEKAKKHEIQLEVHEKKEGMGAFLL